MIKIIKTMLITATLLIVSSVAANADNFDNICRKHRGVENVISLKIGKLGCMILTAVAGDEDPLVKDFLRSSDSFRILVMEGRTNKHLEKDVERYISKNSMQPLITVSNKDENVIIYVENDSNRIKEFLIYVNDGSDTVFLKVKGNYKMNTIKQLVAQNDLSFISTIY